MGMPTVAGVTLVVVAAACSLMPHQMDQVITVPDVAAATAQQMVQPPFVPALETAVPKRHVVRRHLRS